MHGIPQFSTGGVLPRDHLGKGRNRHAARLSRWLTKPPADICPACQCCKEGVKRHIIRSGCVGQWERGDSTLQLAAQNLTKKLRISVLRPGNRFDLQDHQVGLSLQVT